MDILDSGLARLGVGVLLAACLYVWRMHKTTDFSLADEAKLLVVPSLMVGAGLLYTGAGYVDALTATLTALGVALGLNSRGGNR